MNDTPQQTFGALSTVHPLLLEIERVTEMRAMLHELANVFTGVLITSGLLVEKLEGTNELGYAQSLCGLSERGSGLVQRTRALLLGASAMGLDTSGESEG